MQRRLETSRLFALLGALIAVACLVGGCSSPSSVARVSATATATVAQTATPSGPQPTPIEATPGDTSICGVVSPTEFANAAATTASEITSGTIGDSLTGLSEVYCIYDDATDPHQFLARGTINYEFAVDDSSAASIFARVKQSFGDVSEVDEVGDAAFLGVPGGGSDGFGLLVRRGNLLLYLSVSGDEPTVLRVTKVLAALALGRVA